VPTLAESAPGDLPSIGGSVRFGDGEEEIWGSEVVRLMVMLGDEDVLKVS